MTLTLVFFAFVDLVLFGGYDDIVNATQTFRTAHSTMPQPDVFLASETYDYVISKEMLRMEEEARKQKQQRLAKVIETEEAVGVVDQSESEIIAPEIEAIEPGGAPPEKEDLMGPKVKPKIAVIIDDLGMSHLRTNAIIDLKGPLTLAFLPYAPNLAPLTKRSQKQGHELMIHVPMEPMDARLNPGPLAFWNEMSKEEFDIAAEKIFSAFDGYVGINNHMGSKVTQNPKVMDWVMEEVKKRGIFFVDSKTIYGSVASERADAHNIRNAQRDIFLDHVDTPEFVHAALEQLEQKARERGYAIAIGHPKNNTIYALREWLPTLKEKGFELVPASALVKAPDPALVSQAVIVNSPTAPTSERKSIRIKLPDFGIGSVFSSDPVIVK